MPYGIGCTLVRDKLAHYSTFVYGHEAEYIKSSQDLQPDTLSNPHNLALQLSRNFTSLKAYMLLRAHGREKYKRLVQQNLDQIGYLSGLIEEAPNLELMAPVASNVVCFRYTREGLDEGELEKLNNEIFGRLRRTRFGMVLPTRIRGKHVLRLCNVNQKSRKEDFDYLVNEIKKIGKELEVDC